MDEEKEENPRETNSKLDNNKSLAMTTSQSSQSLPLLMTDLCALEPGMDIIPRTPAHGPYHTHHHNNLVHHNFHHHTDQTKSLQELQNEVGALLEFRDLVIETFPDLKHKMASSGASSTITGLQSSSIVSRREWEPGIRVRRKLNNNFSSSSKDGSNSNSGGGEIIQSSSLLTRSRSNSHSGKKEPKSGEGNGSVIQDSGFSTETSSSKEAHSASSTAGSAGVQGNSSALTARLTSDPTSSSSDNELWNLLDVIHRRTSRVPDESDQKFANGKSATAFQSQMNFMRKEDVQLLRKERDHMMDKLGDFEAELLASRIKESTLQDQIKDLQQTKVDLEHQLRHALSQKHEFQASTRPNSNRTFQPIVKTPDDSSAVVLAPQKALKDELNQLGRLDGLISNPSSKLNKVRVPDSKKIAAILLETNIIELQRHLLTITVQNQVLQQRLEQATKSKIYLIKKLDKSKDDVEDLRFQIEERNIELEGTRAQIRVMESKLASRFDGKSPEHQLSSTTTTRLSRDGITVMHTSTPNTRMMQQTISTPSMKAMIPLAMDETFQHSSSTESAHDQQESKCPETPRRTKPSKIPLPGMSKSAISSISSASKPPSGRGSVATGPPSNRSLTKSTNSLYNGTRFSGPPSITRGTRDSSLSRPDSLRNTSMDGKVLRSSSIPISNKPVINSNGSSSPSAAYTTVVNIPSSSPLNSKYVTSSPLPRSKRDSLTTRVKNLDSLSRLQSSSTGTLTTTTSPSSGTIMRSPNSQNSNNNNNLVTNGSNNNRKYTALPVRRMSNNTVRDDHHHDHNVSGGESVNSSGKVHSHVIKKSWTTPNISSTVEDGNYMGEVIQFRSRELIREFTMHKSRVPEILKTPAAFHMSAIGSEINLAYKHPLVIEEELQQDAGEALATDSLPHQHQQQHSIIVPQKTALRNKSNTDRPHLIGKVTPSIARTWEQLSSAMNDDDDDDGDNMSGVEEDKQSYVLFVRKPFNFGDEEVFDVHQASSEKFYDSIEYGDDYEEEQDFDGRETMAEGVDSLEMRENDVIVWSIES